MTGCIRLHCTRIKEELSIVDNAKKNENYIDEDVRYLPLFPTPFGMVPLIGATMTTDRECELFGKDVQTNERK